MTPSLQRKKPRVVWTVAGFDPSSGAGVTADLMTFAAHGAFGCSAITALTVQNTTGVTDSEPVPSPVLRASLDRLREDLPPVGVKIGMLGTPEAAAAVAEVLQAMRGAGRTPVVVLDPVLRSSSGRELFPSSGMSMLEQHLLPAVDWITPNRGELAVLSGREVGSLASAEAASRAVMERHPGMGVVVTGGDEAEPVDLLLLPTGGRVVYSGRRVETTSTHGTGCAFSSALLCELTAGVAPEEAVGRAKRFVEGALRHAPGLGSGRGPMDLLWPLREAAAAREGLVPLRGE